MTVDESVDIKTHLAQYRLQNGDGLGTERSRGATADRRL